MHKKTKEDLKNNKGTKDDLDKPDVTLIDPYFILEMTRVMEQGASKYKRGNWQLSLNPNRILASLLRHVYEVQKNNLTDPESGRSHIAHIACNAMFLYYYQRTGKDISTEYTE